MEQAPGAGLYEALLTSRLERMLERLPADQLVAQLTDLLDAESADRVSAAPMERPITSRDR